MIKIDIHTFSDSYNVACKADEVHDLYRQDLINHKAYNKPLSESTAETAILNS